jgi:hypothetical protein
MTAFRKRTGIDVRHAGAGSDEWRRRHGSG